MRSLLAKLYVSPSSGKAARVSAASLFNIVSASSAMAKVESMDRFRTVAEPGIICKKTGWKYV